MIVTSESMPRENKKKNTNKPEKTCKKKENTHNLPLKTHLDSVMDI
jgi:hypothetical protein